MEGGDWGRGGPAGALGRARAAHWTACGRDAGPLAHPGGAGGAGDAGRALEEAEAAAAWGSGRWRAATEADDLPTGALPFLLAPFHAAALAGDEAVLAARGGAGAREADPGADELRRERRARGLREAASWVDRGIEALAALGLAGGAGEGEGGAECASEDPGKRRERKLRERQRLVALREHTRALEERRAGALVLGVCAGQDDVSLGEWLEELASIPQADWGEEDERSLWLQVVEAQALEARGAAQLARQEADMLEATAAGTPQQLPPDPRSASRERGAKATGLSGLGITVSDNVELQRAMARMLGGERARLQEGVFRPTVALPTMTVEQFGLQERQRMLEREAKQREVEAERAAAQAAKDDRAEEETDEELQKQRAWDDWKDDHPYGSGNSRLRPCA